VPIVGRVASLMQLQACTSEVDRAFWVPLHDLTKPGVFREEWWPLQAVTGRAGERPIYFFEVDNEMVWGATARMLHQLLRVAHRIEGDEPPAI